MRILSLNVANSSSTCCECVCDSRGCRISHHVHWDFGGLFMAWVRTPLPWECIGKMDAITIIPRLHSNVLFRSRHFISKLFKPNFLVKTKRRRSKRRRMNNKKMVKTWEWMGEETEKNWAKDSHREFYCKFYHLLLLLSEYSSVPTVCVCLCTRLAGIFTSSTVS